MNIGKFNCFTVRERTPVAQEAMSSPQSLYELARDKLNIGASPCEEMWCFYLNTKLVITGYELISKGGLDSTNSHPREVFRGAILNNAKAIIVMHNHPSNDVSTPSQADIVATKQLYESGKILGIELLDHLIISNNDYLSLREAGFIQ